LKNGQLQSTTQTAANGSQLASPPGKNKRPRISGGLVEPIIDDGEESRLNAMEDRYQSQKSDHFKPEFFVESMTSLLKNQGLLLYTYDPVSTFEIFLRVSKCFNIKFIGKELMSETVFFQFEAMGSLSSASGSGTNFESGNFGLVMQYYYPGIGKHALETMLDPPKHEIFGFTVGPPRPILVGSADSVKVQHYPPKPTADMIAELKKWREDGGFKWTRLVFKYNKEKVEVNK
jgi:hypothetical protein